jgi:UDP-N-acetylglucosamine 2-epimerase (non-hydrolysing)
MKTIHLVAAARPNFMKIAPLYHVLSKVNWAKPIIVHTGQHYDVNMSDAFFEDLRLPKPHIHLGVGSGSHAEQTGKVMIEYEKVLLSNHPDLVIVVGDVNSTVAATIAAVKLGIKTAHLEAGLRSFDRTMPEEINRVITDSIADILWTPSADGDENLLKEGVGKDKIKRVGNIMIDSLEMMRTRIEADVCCAQLGLTPSQFGLVTLHRPVNVDCSDKLAQICSALETAADIIPLVLPLHPRTRKNLIEYGLMKSLKDNAGITLHEPLSYIRFMNLVFNSRLVITDSGGVQEETTYLGIPCITLRQNTERPVTISKGTNRLCTVEGVLKTIKEILQNRQVSYKPPELWDGHTAERINANLVEYYNI